MTEEDFTLAKGFEIIKNSKNNIILFGSIGVWKTTFLNKICGQNLKQVLDLDVFLPRMKFIIIQCNTTI